ncbi:tetratricopeptide repeat protein [Flavobacterium sp. ARAG 55.4]|uniref:tetratricopeptide repeat protein n=1 Tax=Flavobacterium sp. ARAG 55.4 TaxID=3451357 RepID=UPI003F4487FF
MKELITEISKKIKLQEYAIFCGAGISLNSGLPIVTQFLNYVLDSINVEKVDIDKILNSNLPFESFIQTIKEESNIDHILDIFSKGEPNTNHLFIAELVKQGNLKNIFTTNFDILIEKAIKNKGLVENTDFKVHKSEKDFENINWNDGKVKIIKIHGCITDKEEMAITLELVAKQILVENKNKAIASFFSKKINPKIMVLGYSCSDVFDISPLIESIDNEKSEITFIEHSQSELEFNQEEISERNNKNPFIQFVGHRITTSTGLLIKDLWKNLISINYENKVSNIDWKANIDKWLTEACDYSIGIKNQISGRILYDIGQYKTAIKIWEKGLNIAQKENNQIFFYSLLGNIGMAQNSLGNFKEAISCLEESANACRENGNSQGEVSQLQALGNIYRNLRQFDKSLNAFQKAVNIAEKFEPESLCSTLGNLATVYNQTGDYDEAIKVLNKGIVIANSVGGKQSEGSMLASFGIAYFQKGDFDKASKFTNESIEVTRLIGDKNGECLSLHNLSNFCLQFERYDDAIKYSTISLNIAKEIGIKPSIASAYYNIGTSNFFKGEIELAIINLKKSISLYMNIFGKKHQYTQSAIKTLERVEKYPNSNKMTKMNLK